MNLLLFRDNTDYKLKQKPPEVIHSFCAILLISLFSQSCDYCIQVTTYSGKMYQIVNYDLRFYDSFHQI